MIGIYFREMNCIYCESNRVVKNGKKQSGGKSIQRYLCNECGKRCNERSGTPIARLRTPVETIAMAMKMRSEGLGIRATGRVLGKSGTSISNWEQRISNQLSHWSPTAPVEAELVATDDGRIIMQKLLKVCSGR
jgi:transposase-like protein